MSPIGTLWFVGLGLVGICWAVEVFDARKMGHAWKPAAVFAAALFALAPLGFLI